MARYADESPYNYTRKPAPLGPQRPPPAERFVVDCGYGVVWLCCFNKERCITEAFAQEVAPTIAAVTAASKSGSSASSKASVDAISGALSGCSPSQDVRVIVPEACEELGFCRWDGDGHYDCSRYCNKAPPSICQVVHFVRMCRTAICQKASAVIQLSSEAKRAEAAILAGAVMILNNGLSASQAWRRIAPSCPPTNSLQAWNRFPRPFRCESRCLPSSVTVQDCLEALEKAKELGWLDVEAFNEDEFVLLRRKYDASWIIPGQVMALGDPLSTARNPAYPGLLPFARDEDGLRPSNRIEASGPFFIEDSGITSSDFVMTKHSQESLDSTRESRDSTVDEDDFQSMFRKLGIGFIIRLNQDRYSTAESDDSQASTPSHTPIIERLNSEMSGCKTPTPAKKWGRNNGQLSVPEPPSEGACSPASSLRSPFTPTPCTPAHFRPRLSNDEAAEHYAQMLEDGGLQVKAYEFVDGGVPSASIVKQFLHDVDAWQAVVRRIEAKQLAFAVHCRAGLGRTGVIIGIYVTTKYRMSGKAFHGWMRMCRPGAVQTTVQEQYVRELPKPVKVKSSLALNLSWSSMNSYVRQLSKLWPWKSSTPVTAMAPSAAGPEVVERPPKTTVMAPSVGPVELH